MSEVPLYRDTSLIPLSKSLSREELIKVNYEPWQNIMLTEGAFTFLYTITKDAI